ncbi:MAG: hypothetical protein V2I36_14855 [Desulfopila sp.]|jgi:fibronectin type 3 domain-containing protein|nr:hypothetical protein [Desulfopila sp.]
MKLKKSIWFAGTILLTGTLLSGGCGYKTDPVPPQTVVPQAIEDLSYTLDKEGARLSWSYPLETVSGKTIEQILSFELYRAEMPLADFCGGCPIPFGEPLQLPGGAAGVEERNTTEYLSGMLRSGNKYFFKVRSRTSWWAASADSNIVSFVFHTPAGAPVDLKAVSAEGSVRLSWSPVTTLVDGSPAEFPLTYQVMKSRDGRQYVETGELLQEKTSYVDQDVESGTTYHYKIKSSMLYENDRIDGSLSEAVSVKAKDAVPPPAVTGVTVVASAADIRIFWDGVTVDDLAGYTIYRRTEGENMARKIGEVGNTQTIFVDGTALPDGRVYYSVSAFDKEGNEGKKSAEATTRH